MVVALDPAFEDPASNPEHYTPGRLPSATNTYSRRSTSVEYNPQDELQSTVFVGSKRPKTVYDPRMNKVAEQLGEEYGGHTTARSPMYASVYDLLADFDSFKHKDFLRLRNLLAGAGYVDDKAQAAEVRASYASLAVNMAQEGIRMTPIDYLRNLIRLGGGDPDSIASGQRKKWKQVHTDKTIYELDPTEARQLVTQTMQQYLGRDPTKHEIQDFIHAVNTQAEEDPTVSRSTTKYRKGGDISTTTREVVDTGFGRSDAIQQAIDEAKGSPDYAEYQAVSTYMPVVESLLNASVAI